MTVRPIILSSLLILAGASAARADLRLSVAVDPRPADINSSAQPCNLPLELGTPLGETSSQPVTHTLDLPHAPGSAGLFLSAVLSVGALRVMRSAKALHISAIPDWYHTGGPHQIGHTVVCELDFGLILPCQLPQIVPPLRAAARAIAERAEVPIVQYLRTVRVPRAPPAFSI